MVSECTSGKSLQRRVTRAGRQLRNAGERDQVPPDLELSPPGAYSGSKSTISKEEYSSMRMFLLSTLLLAGAAGVFAQAKKAAPPPFMIMIPDLKDGAELPIKYSCSNAPSGVSPKIDWMNARSEERRVGKEYRSRWSA